MCHRLHAHAAARCVYDDDDDTGCTDNPKYSVWLSSLPIYYYLSCNYVCALCLHHLSEGKHITQSINYILKLSQIHKDHIPTNSYAT